MAAFMVTSSELKSKANELRNLNAQFKSQEGSLVSMWEGEARDAFDMAFKNDKTQMDNFYNLIEQYCAALETIAAKYEAAEARNLSTAQTRTY